MIDQSQSFDPRQIMNNTSFEVFHYKDLKPADVDVHHHDFYEIYNLISGNVSYWVDGKTYHLRPGDVLLISPMELHRPILSENTQYERFVLWINKNFLDTISQSDLLTRCFNGVSNHIRGSSITQLLNELVAEKKSDKYASEICAYGIFLQIMVELNRLSPVGSQTADHTEMINEVLYYIGTHFHSNLSLDTLAEKYHISKYHLSHQFKKETGTSIYHYITLKRLAAARQMLIDGHAPGDVYTACGFRDYTVFYKAFKSEYGSSPIMSGNKSKKSGETP